MPALVGSDRSTGASRGQIIPLFALALVMIVSAVGLVIDAGGAWAQKRNQQRGADLAALAGATAEANGSLNAAIRQAVVDSAEANGYAASEVTINIPPQQTGSKYSLGGSGYSPNDCSSAATSPCWIEVVISRPHQNTFAAIVPGQQKWGVSARAVTVGGIANAAYTGAAPIMFDVSAVREPPDDERFCNVKQNNCPSPNDPVPVNENQYAWTEFCYKDDPNCNFDSSRGKKLINGELGLTVQLGMDLGPNNSGQHVDVCAMLMDVYPDGGDVVVAISKPDPLDDRNALLIGIWVFAFDPDKTDCNGANAPIIGGTFVTEATSTLPLTIVAGGDTPEVGQFVARLVE